MRNYSILILMFCSIPAISLADPVSSVPAVVPSVEDNLRKMDRDRNGLVTASEVRAYLELKHGKGYEKAILDKMQSSEGGASCGTPFAQTFY